MKNNLLGICIFLFSLTTYAQSLTISSASFKANTSLAKQYTCDGADIAPAMAWSAAPANTKSFVLIMSDPDAPGGEFYHWVVYNIPSIISSFSEGQTEMPAGTMVAENSFDKRKYSGPCPPAGSSHRYYFKLYALDTRLVLPVNADETSVLNAIKGHVIEEASLTAHYP